MPRDKSNSSCSGSNTDGHPAMVSLGWTLSWYGLSISLIQKCFWKAPIQMWIIVNFSKNNRLTMYKKHEADKSMQMNVWTHWNEFRCNAEVWCVTRVVRSATRTLVKTIVMWECYPEGERKRKRVPVSDMLLLCLIDVDALINVAICTPHPPLIHCEEDPRHIAHV